MSLEGNIRITHSSYRYIQTHNYHIPGGGGGELGISSDGDDQMEPKVKNQKIPRASSKTPKNPWTKN